MNRIAYFVEMAEKNLQSVSSAEAKALDKTLDISFQEHYTFQNQQSAAFAGGKLSEEEAKTIYSSLGQVHTITNGGWAKGTSLAMKGIVTKVICELLEQKIKGN